MRFGRRIERLLSLALLAVALLYWFEIIDLEAVAALGFVTGAIAVAGVNHLNERLDEIAHKNQLTE